MKPAGIAVLSVILLGSHFTLPAAAQPAPVANPVVQPADGSKDTFRAHVRTDLANWRIKMRDFDKNTETSGHRNAIAATAELRSAWNRTKLAGRRVADSSRQDWVSVKASYEAASHEMAVAWDKAWH